MKTQILMIAVLLAGISMLTGSDVRAASIMDTSVVSASIQDFSVNMVLEKSKPKPPKPKPK
jgi:hypothetical protein